MLSRTAQSAALARFDVLQELSPEGGHKVLLGRSKGGKLATIEVLAEEPISGEPAAVLSRQSSLAAKLTADSVVQTRALILESDLAAVVCEFVPGVSLQRLLRFASGRGVRLPELAGWYAVERVLDALAHAHAQSDDAGGAAPLVHGGVSPSSVVVAWDGTVKLGDFGLVRMREALARPGQPADAIAPIMAPEQAGGGAVTERADVFCAALLALRVATGRTPYGRFKRGATERILAMSEGKVTKLGKTRPDLPKPLLDAFDLALAVDPEARTVTARELRDVVRASFDVTAGRESLATLLGRWRDGLEKTVTPWERRASMHDGAAPTDAEVREGTLALATADERPSADALVSADARPDEPWNKGALAPSEAPLAATDPVNSLSRVGATATDALTMPPLPPMRITMPSLPVYGGEPVNIPRPIPPKPFFSGGKAAAIVGLVFALLIAAAIVLFRWLLAPPPT